MSNSTERFSSRVENYIKYRPSYPPEVFACLKHECGLSKATPVADIGSGTGIFSQLLAEHAGRVYGVEPNREMREAAERLLADLPTFTSVNGTSEQTQLPANSVDLITAAQAFHWFDRVAARREFARILKPGGWVALIWNDRRVDTTPFLTDYERVLRTYATDYAQVNHREISPEMIAEFYAPGRFKLAQFYNVQHFDYAGLEGRLNSSSYAPEASDARHAPMLQELRGIFDRYQHNGRVAFEYDTQVYYGQLA